MYSHSKTSEVIYSLKHTNKYLQHLHSRLKLGKKNKTKKHLLYYFNHFFSHRNPHVRQDFFAFNCMHTVGQNPNGFLFTLYALYIRYHTMSV